MQLPVKLYLPRRQALLFLIAILVPCGVLLALGLRMMQQETQLEEKRLADERHRLVGQVRQELLSELEQIKIQHVTRVVASAGGTEDALSDELVAFVGLLKDGQLLLPWENSPAARKFRRSLEVGEFAKTIHEAEALELVAHQPENAVSQYRSAIEITSEPAQKTHARLALARVLQKSGHLRESQMEYEKVLASPPDVVDEHGVPFGLYAALALLDADANQDKFVEWVEVATDGGRPLSRAALGMARDLAVKFRASDSVARLTGLIRDREQADALQRDFGRLIPPAQNHDPVWVAYGDPVWMMSVTPPVPAFDGLVVAVRASEILKQLDVSGAAIRLATAAERAGQSLGESFSGLRIVIATTDEAKSGSGRSVLAVALILALTFTMVAGYLLWRDVQRDLRLAEMRSQFVSSITHELKTPLTAIRMFAETLKLDEEVNREIRAEYLDTILHESERLSRLVDNVLDFGKIERGRKTYRFQPVRLDEVVEKAARAAQYPLEQAGFALETAVEPDLPPVSADSDALQQAILNLLTNAMKYSGTSRRIGLRLERKNGRARIQVEDHGIGIAVAEQQRIFERFYRAPTVENQHIPGTGLGLTIVSHVVRAHGGNVEVASRPGSGSLFTLSLPLRTDT